MAITAKKTPMNRLPTAWNPTLTHIPLGLWEEVTCNAPKPPVRVTAVYDSHPTLRVLSARHKGAWAAQMAKDPRFVAFESTVDGFTFTGLHNAPCFLHHFAPAPEA